MQAFANAHAHSGIKAQAQVHNRTQARMYKFGPGLADFGSRIEPIWKSGAQGPKFLIVVKFFGVGAFSGKKIPNLASNLHQMCLSVYRIGHAQHDADLIGAGWVRSTTACMPA